VTPGKVVQSNRDDLTKDVQLVSAFSRNSGGFMKRLKKTKRPIVLTVNGKAEAVVQGR